MTEVMGSVFSASQKIGLDGTTALGYLVPPIACLYLMGVLVQLEDTRVYRLALLPVVVWFSWRGSFVDVSGGDPKMTQGNVILITNMCSLAMRATVWAVAKEPYRRQSTTSKGESVMWNSVDLILNNRGIGWNWPRGLVVPKPVFETDSRLIFVLWSAMQMVFYVFAFDACIHIIRVLSPDTFGSVDGGTLFDGKLPPAVELLRAVFVSAVTVFLACFALQWAYHLLAIVYITLFRQRPWQWPPLFDSPWLATSLTELWGRRWHQMMRSMLMTLGVRPFSVLFGRWAGPIGAFLVSGIFHDVELRSLGRGGNSVKVIGFWVMNGVGVVLERAWMRKTGKRVGGVWGWMWTFGWLALWGVPAVDEWAKAGRFGTLSLPGEVEPARGVIEWLSNSESYSNFE